MADINSVAVSGRVVRDADLKQGQFILCTFSLAVNKKKKVGSEWKDEAQYFDVVLFGKQAEYLSSKLRKGVAVGVQGELKQDRWTEATGVKRTKVTINARTVTIFERSQARQEDQQPSYDFDDVPF